MIEWVTITDSWNKWYTIWILALTHGNEIAWLRAQQEFIRKWYDKLISDWRVIFICVNIEAYKKNIRFIDVNMNRVWKFLEKIEAYEVDRFKEILPMIDQCDIILDIHSVSKNTNNLMAICHSKDWPLAKRILKTDRLLVDDNFDEEWSLISFVTKRWWIWFWIECWYHEQDDARKNALDNIVSLLRYYEMIECEYVYQTEHQIKSEYQFYQEVLPMSLGFKYTKKYNNFDVINPWEVYAIDWDRLYLNNTTHNIYIWMIWNTVTPWDGICFLFTKTN